MTESDGYGQGSDLTYAGTVTWFNCEGDGFTFRVPVQARNEDEACDKLLAMIAPDADTSGGTFVEASTI